MPLISLTKEKQVRRLLKGELSNRQIARQTGVSRGTVATIKKQSALRPRTLAPLKQRKLRKPRRCNKCGGMVKRWPCLLCNPWSGDYDIDYDNTTTGEE